MHGRILFVLFCLMLPHALYADPFSRNQLMLEMADSMLDMAKLWNKMQNTQEGSSRIDSKQQGLPSQNIPPFRLENTGFLDGLWLSEDDNLLIIYRGLGRIYVARTKYDDFLVDLRPGLLLLTSLDQHITRGYQLGWDNGMMLLRDQKGQIMRFAKLKPYP